MLVSFTMPLWQNAFCQVLCDWTSLVFADEHNATFLFVYYKLAGSTLGLGLICVFTHTWPIESLPSEVCSKG